MANPVYKKIQLVGTSTQSFSDAVAQAIQTAAQTEKNLSWFEVVELRGSISEGKVAQYQVTVNIGCRVVPEQK